MREIKEVQKITRKENFYFSILYSIKQGSNPAKIRKKLGISKQNLNYYISGLKKLGCIKKIGYGTWKAVKDLNIKEVKKTTQIGKHNPHKLFTSFQPDTVRAHAFQFTFRLPKLLKNWGKRKEFLDKNNIKYNELNIFGGGQQLVFKGRKIWLTNKSIVIFEKASYFADTAEESRSYAVADALDLIKSLERKLRANLGIYKFKVSRQHFALIKNALAKQYDREGKKLAISNQHGQWFLIDNSYNYHESETVHPKTAPDDNRNVQDFFNGLKDLEGYTPQFVMNALGDMVKNASLYNENIALHVQAIKDLGTGINKYNQNIDILIKAVKKIKGAKQ